MTADFVVQDHSFRISCSVGISVFHEHGADGETLLRNADTAMYCAKESGRNSFRFYTNDMNTQVVERLTLENSLRVALRCCSTRLPANFEPRRLMLEQASYFVKQSLKNETPQTPVRVLGRIAEQPSPESLLDFQPTVSRPACEWHRQARKGARSCNQRLEPAGFARSWLEPNCPPRESRSHH
jgi:hypothetical protein